MAKDITIKDFLGLNNVLPAEELQVKEGFKTTGYYLNKATNVNIDNRNKVKRRNGYDLKYAGDCHSMWSDGSICLFRSGSDLQTLSEDFLSATTLRTGITGSLNMAYLSLNNKVYYSDGNITGVIENGASRSWGLDIPTAPILLSSIPGSLKAGIYQVCLTYVRDDGQESGSSDAVSITLANNTSGIRIAGIVLSSDPSVSKIRVYVSRRDSEIFYLAYTLTNTSQTIDRTSEDGLTAISLKTQFLSPPPAGQILEYYGGMIHIGSFDVDWYTEPFKYELCNVLTNHIQFQNDLSMIGAVDQGIFYGTDEQISFARGTGPKNFKFEDKADYGAIFGTMRKINRHDIGKNEAMSTFIMFASKKGLCIGASDGDLVNKTRDVYDYTATDIGAGFTRREDGIDQYIAVLGKT